MAAASIERSQRERLLDAMVSAVAEKGYLATTVADVTGRAGISRMTFYEIFKDKEDCFVASLDWLIERLTNFAGSAWQRHGEWPRQVRAGLGALLGALAARPQLARVAIAESDAAGPRARDRIRVAIDEFVPYLDQGRRLSEHREALPEQVSLIVVGGVAGIIFEEVLSTHAKQLLRLLPELLYTVLVPYLGHEAAVAEMRAAARRLEQVGAAGATG